MAQTIPKTGITELARACGVKPPSVSNWLDGKTKNLEGKNLLLASNFFKCNEEWLATGKGGPFPNGTPQKPNKSELNKDGDVLISQFDAVGAMGDGLVLRDQSGIIESWKVSRDWVSKNVKAHSGITNLCIVTGFGDSMRPMFNSGDPLLVDIGIKTVEFDAIYFFRVGAEGFIKRLQRIPGDGIRAISENKGYEGWTIKPDMDFEVFGRVLKVWCSEDF
ncbi:S24 family peptidase [Polynucleobacter sp. AP-RePozz3-80-G7]|uniref:S24 family peptidase n=1 Tax=Polynucleobacter sp. AP-RePozz3-80-G7 TaxID=2689105 RepID=UPI0021060417|nr:S24 family peptidase [Polynucleobacter sp. AP-RePozz3-80-G7]